MLIYLEHHLLTDQLWFLMKPVKLFRRGIQTKLLFEISS